MGFATTASAAPIQQCGINLCFSYDDATLYGTGQVIGNNIFFLSTGFDAESLNGEGLVTVDDMIEITISVNAATPEYVLTGVALAEQGDYLLNGAGASVSVSGTLELESVSQGYTDMSAYDAGPLTNQGALTQWDLDDNILLSDTAGWNYDDAVVLNLYNVLTADTAANGEQAFIEKKIGAFAVGLDFEVNVIPIPAAVWLFGSALAGLGFVRRRQAAC